MSKMDVKGQISVEYLMIALVFLIIMTTVTVPLIGNSIMPVWMFQTLPMLVML